MRRVIVHPLSRLCWPLAWTAGRPGTPLPPAGAPLAPDSWGGTAGGAQAEILSGSAPLHSRGFLQIQCSAPERLSEETFVLNFSKADLCVSSCPPLPPRAPPRPAREPQTRVRSGLAAGRGNEVFLLAGSWECVLFPGRTWSLHILGGRSEVQTSRGKPPSGLLQGHQHRGSWAFTSQGSESLETPGLKSCLLPAQGVTLLSPSLWASKASIENEWLSLPNSWPGSLWLYISWSMS